MYGLKMTKETLETVPRYTEKKKDLFSFLFKKTSIYLSINPPLGMYQKIL